SLADYRIAYWLFLLVNIACAGLAICLMNVSGRNWLYAAVLIAFFPLSAAIADGQDSILLLLIATGSCWFFSRKNHFLAGAVLALGLFRFQLVLPIAGVMFLWKRWRFLSGITVSSAVLMVISGILGGFHQLQLYGSSLLSLGAVAQARAGYLVSVSQLRRM